MADEADNGADLGAFMAGVEEPQEEPYIYEPPDVIRGTSAFLKAAKDEAQGKPKRPHSYDYYPKYLIRAAEEEIEKHYNPETQTLALPSTPEPLALPAPAPQEPKEYVYSTRPRFQIGESGMYEPAPAPTPSPIEPIVAPLPEPEPEPTEARKYQRNGQKIEMEVIPMAPEPTPAEKLKEAEARVAQEAQQEVKKEVAKEVKAEEKEKPIAAFTAATAEDRLKALMKEINELKKEQEDLKKIRDLKLERLKLKWNTITAKIKARHPYITALIEKGVKMAGPAAKAAVSAGRSFAAGLGNLATKIASPYPGQLVTNAFDQLGGFHPMPTQGGAPALNSINTNDLAKEAERLRLERSIITQRAQLANQRAIVSGKPLPYPQVPTYAQHEKKQRRKSLGEIVRQVEKEKLQAELDRVKKLATA